MWIRLVGLELVEEVVGQRVERVGLAHGFARKEEGLGVELVGPIVALFPHKLISITQVLFQLWWADLIKDSTDEDRRMEATSSQGSEELAMFRLSWFLSQFVDLRLEESSESPDIAREETLHEVLLRRKKTTSRSPQEIALRQLGIEGTDVTALVSAGRPRRNGYAPLRLTYDPYVGVLEC
ncbi:unnamed protein product [Linum trigynum]|uniref:Uncharacterized protein n=1 Tax=Linum trigynum TaxID=586398 RepID=A0AAV2EFY0_9ROSI